MKHEIESIAELRQHVAEHGDLAGLVIQGLDLTGATEFLCSHPAAGAVLLGCALEPRALDHVHASGSLVFPQLQDRPFHPYRPRLYTVDELMEGYRRGDPSSFARDTSDSAIYRYIERLRREGGSPPLLETLAQRLHDHAIDDALGDLLHDREKPRKVVAIMGGHGLLRSDPMFLRVARLGRELTLRGYFLATGGGPGAMEAGNLGAWMANRGQDELDEAVSVLSLAPHYSDEAFIDRGYEVRDRFPEGTESLAVPTWFYGHEPTNLFATHIAKYFANSIREEGLLAIATHGVVFAPGSAGTIQEVFMDAAQNHYGSLGTISPMVFLGKEFWTESTPVYPLLSRLARDRRYGEMLTCSDDEQDIADFIVDHPPATTTRG